jgi:hypothetical protein
MKRIILLTLPLLLAACGSAVTEPTVTPVDVNLIQTAVVQTIMAQATQTARAVPTNTPEPSPEPTGTPDLPPTETLTPEATPTQGLCDDAVFVADVSVPDGMQMNPGQEFVKTWRVKNTGTCTWTRGYQIIWSYGDNRMGGQATALTGDVLPGEEVNISLTLKAPLTSGTYRGYWILRNNNGFTFGKPLFVIITVP